MIYGLLIHIIDKLEVSDPFFMGLFDTIQINPNFPPILLLLHLLLSNQTLNLGYDLRQSKTVFFAAAAAAAPLSAVQAMDMLMPLSESTTGSKKNDRSVFVMVTFETDLGGLDRGILYEFKIKHGGGGEIIIGGKQVEQEQEGTLGGGIMALHPAHSFFAGLNTDSIEMTHFQCARFCNSPKLCLLHHTLHCGLSFDTRNMSWGEAFTRPIHYYPQGPLISAYGNLYYFADPSSYPHSTHTTFQRYDPTTGSWDRLPPCPFYSCEWMSHTVGYAVSRGCILFSLMFNHHADAVVFNISTQTWHKRAIPDSNYSHYFPFYGRAVVVDDDTICAPTYATGEMLVIKFSLRLLTLCAGDGDGPYFIVSLTVLPGLGIVLPPSPLCKIGTYNMVHLGDFEFCLVYSYNDPLYRQNLCITTFRIVPGSSVVQQYIKTLHSTVADFYLPPNNNRNHIVFSFTPDYDDDDTQSQKFKTATTVEPAKYKSFSPLPKNPKPTMPSLQKQSTLLRRRSSLCSAGSLSKNDRSVFVMVKFVIDDCMDGGILYEVKIKHGGGGEIIIGGKQVEQEQQGTFGVGGGNMALHPAQSFFVGLNTDSIQRTHFQCARFCSSSKLYLIRDTLHSGLIFDTTTQTMSSTFRRPFVYFPNGHLISAYGNLYYFADSLPSPHSTDTNLQQYDPTTDSWKCLPPCPFYSYEWHFYTEGYAVCRGCILFSLRLRLSYAFDFLVFNIRTQTWHKLAKLEELPNLTESAFSYIDYFPFFGRAVVVDDDTIYVASYAGSTGSILVMKFSFRVPVDAADVDDSYFIDSLIVLPGLEIVPPPPSFCNISSYYMVHLGDFEFCLVYNYYDLLCRQNLCITTFRIVRNSSSPSTQQHIKTLHSIVSDFYHPPNNAFNHIVFSFTPDYDDDDDQNQEYKTATTVKPAKHKRSVATTVKRAKHKSVCAFDAKEVPSPPRRKRRSMDSEARSHMSSANRKEYSLKERSADRVERSHRKISVNRNEQYHDMTSIGRDEYFRRSSVDADREESYHKRGSRHREEHEHSHERNSISSRGERSHRRSSLGRKESSHKRGSRDREESSHKRSSTDREERSHKRSFTDRKESSHKRSSTDGSHKTSFMDRKEHSQERNTIDKGEQSRKRSSVDMEESSHRMNSMDRDAHSHKHQKHSSNSHRPERRRSSRDRY